PDESGVSPLARHRDWYEVPCPECGETAQRETDVSDTFLDSSWYFLRYPSTEFDDRAFDKEITKRWLPVSQYIGGNEHAVLHLMYSRFITMVLHDLGHLDFEEPYKKFRAHGTIVREGAKMSKSRGNVVVPDEYIEKWGADTFRMYLMFLGPYQEGGDFRDEGIAGIRRFLDKVWAITGNVSADASLPSDEVVRKLHQTIRKVTDDIDGLRYNTAIAALMEYVNLLRNQDGTVLQKETVEPLITMLAPLAPHIAEECWERLGHDGSVFEASWPELKEELTEETTFQLVVQVNGKVRDKIDVAADITKEQALELAKESDAVKKHLDGREPKKVIFVPGRLLNLVG
ncbi:MAG: class I tRNA ligase family protein, partial [Gemmatimonadota bacterium]|nr:class I tRNA ligase family protein [Gemmatimonadota bacterium]